MWNIMLCCPSYYFAYICDNWTEMMAEHTNSAIVQSQNSAICYNNRFNFHYLMLPTVIIIQIYLSITNYYVKLYLHYCIYPFICLFFYQDLKLIPIALFWYAQRVSCQNVYFIIFIIPENVSCRTCIHITKLVVLLCEKYRVVSVCVFECLFACNSIAIFDNISIEGFSQWFYDSQVIWLCPLFVLTEIPTNICRNFHQFWVLQINSVSFLNWCQSVLISGIRVITL